MKTRSILPSLLALLVATGAAAAGGPETARAKPEARSCHLPGADGSLRCVAIPVPLD